MKAMKNGFHHEGHEEEERGASRTWGSWGELSQHVQQAVVKKTRGASPALARAAEGRVDDWGVTRMRARQYGTEAFSSAARPSRPGDAHP
jgi:hypothetical protein